MVAKPGLGPEVMKRIFRGIALLMLTFVGTSLYAQLPPPQDDLFYNNGQVYIDSGVVVQIYGKTVTEGARSILRNDGELYVHFDTAQRYLSQNVAEGFIIDNFGIVSGSGYYEIEPDWTNNSPNFVPGQSHVNLMSDEEQLITGTEITNFYELQLSGDGLIGRDRIKRMTIDAFVQDSLSLNNRELATDSFIMTLRNPEVTALTHNNVMSDLGFVSSLKGDNQQGSLVRRTANSAEFYLFPTGSSVNPPGSDPYIYRPVEVRPSSNNNNSYGVRFIHESAELEGYNLDSLGDSVCSVNPLYYHMVNRPQGTDSATVRFYYDHLTDNIYDHVVQWRNGQWNLDKTSTMITPGAFYVTYIPNNKIFSTDSLPFALADRRPDKAVIVGDPGVCADDLAMLRAIGNSSFYNWTAPGDMEILSEQGNDTVIMKANTMGGWVQLNASSSTNKCIEAADSFLLEVYPVPEANFTSSENETFTKQLIQFRDSTEGSPVEWYWVFGDGNTASSPITKHRFENVGEYIVVMYVKDDNGCRDSTSQLISIIEGISVPNVFTPNGDGNNDLFYIPNSGMKSYHFKVFNRWGILLFETTAPEIAWDGYSNAGEQVVEGTYFYTLEAQGEQDEYVLKGYLTLFR